MKSMILVVTFAVSAPAFAQVAAPVRFVYEGYLENGSGPVTNTVSVGFGLFADPVDTVSTFDELYVGVNVVDGYFTLVVGEQSSLLPSDLKAFPFLEVAVNGEVLGRQELLWAPLAARAEAVDWAGIENKPAFLADDVVSFNELGGIPATLSDGAVDFGELTGVSAVLDDGAVTFAEVSAKPAFLADNQVSYSELVGVSADFTDGAISYAELDGVSSDFADGAITFAELDAVPADLADGNIDWLEISGIPADVFDGDQTSSLSITGGNGITLSPTTITTTGTISANFGTGATQVATGNHNHDADYVEKGVIQTSTSSVTVTIGASGTALVFLRGACTSGLTGRLGFSISGATTRAASTAQSISVAFSGTGSVTQNAGATFVASGLTAGSNTFTPVVLTANCTGNEITVLPL